jgi:hypothetical protein
MPDFDNPAATFPDDSMNKLQKQWVEKPPVLVHWKMKKP